MASPHEMMEVAKAICRSVTDNNCVMDENPERPPCTTENCRMMRLAVRVLEEAQSGADK